ncbi:MAG: hypothetical protein S0880_19405 [Actinomycetota bacterium]|nr:hypothetical protein [Actinomycetota bacterium]
MYADEGSETELATVDVPAEVQGASCEGEAQADNQSSVHPNNDLIIRTGDVEAIIEDVEDEPGKNSVTAGSVVLGETISVSLRMGVDEVFSGGIVVSIDCTTPPATEDGAATADDAAADDVAAETEPAEDAAAADVDTEVAGESVLAMTGPAHVRQATILATVLVALGAALLAVGRVGRDRAAPPAGR